ncbi:MAG: response regulator [Rhodospirillaceae bacterium]|nr:response regulator [Rhodospirillaceae bacterium]
MNNSPFTDINVLCVDDEEFARGLISRLLASIGVNKVIEAENGANALPCLEDSANDIHIIISDIEMPGMNGYEFVRRVRYGVVPRYKVIPILMLTGKDSDKNVRSARIHKINGFLVKPSNADEVRAQMSHALKL